MAAPTLSDRIDAIDTRYRNENRDTRWEEIQAENDYEDFIVNELIDFYRDEPEYPDW